MTEKTVALVFERDTKGTFVFTEEEVAGQPLTLKSVYVQRWAVPAGTKKLTVVLRFE